MNARGEPGPLGAWGPLFDRSDASFPPPRLIVDAATSGAWNMAVDEVLLTSAADQRLCTLRFYEWSEPTLSLGYFQSFAERAKHAGSRTCPVVRRASGGGAIVHDQELTYCLAVPLAHPLAADATRLYTLVHEALIATLAQRQITAYRSAGNPAADQSAEPFLCFARRAAGDMVIDLPAQRGSRAADCKICGSAQRRRQGAVVQHGSILLARSEAAEELPGIAEVTGVGLSPQALAAAWQPHLEALLGVRWQSGGLTPAETDRVRSLAIEKYDSASWTRRR